MELTTVRSVDTLDEPQRQAFESVVGSPLAPDQHVLIMVYTPSVPSEDARRLARDNLDRLYEQTDAHATRLGVTQDEFDAAVDEAIDHVRRQRLATS
jgi:hypothetical protein